MVRALAFECGFSVARPASAADPRYFMLPRVLKYYVAVFTFFIFEATHVSRNSSSESSLPSGNTVSDNYVWILDLIWLLFSVCDALDTHNTLIHVIILLRFRFDADFLEHDRRTRGYAGAQVIFGMRLDFPIYDASWPSKIRETSLRVFRLGFILSAHQNCIDRTSLYGHPCFGLAGTWSIFPATGLVFLSISGAVWCW